MPTDARAILSAAAHVIDAFERRVFEVPDPDSDISSFEWDDGYATLEEDGCLFVEIPNGNRTLTFWLCPTTGKVTPGNARH